MLATKYFRTKQSLTTYAQIFRKMHPLNWYIRTTLECDHTVISKRKAIILVTNETLVQRLIYCKICNEHGNAIVEPKTV